MLLCNHYENYGMEYSVCVSLGLLQDYTCHFKKNFARLATEFMLRSIKHNAP